MTKARTGRAAAVTPDLPALIGRLTAAAQRWHPGAAITALRALPGGESSLTYLASVDGAPDDRTVVKVAPAGLPSTRNRNMMRQARLLAELGRTGTVPVPRLLFTDDGTRALVGEYAEAFGTSIEGMPWFLALALFKFTATTGLIAKHALKREDTANWGVRMLPKLGLTLVAAQRLLDEP